MVSNPFSDGVSVQIQGDSSGLSSAVDNAVANLGNLKMAAGATGAALGALAVGGLAKSASAAADFEAAMADVEKVTSAQTAEELSEPIQEMATELPLAAEEISKLAAQAGRFGAEGTEEVKEFTRVAAEMGAATTLAADEAGRSLAKLSTALDEPLGNVQQLGDSINELSNNFATNSQEIVDAAQRGGFALQEMGMQSDQILGVATALNEVYPSARRAGNAMKLLGESMTDPSNVTAFAEALGVTEQEFRKMREQNPDETLMQVAQAMKESDEASQTLSGTLSTQQTRAFQRLGQQVDSSRQAMEMSNQAMEEGGSLAREVAIETDTLQGQWALFKSEINNVARSIGSTLAPSLAKLLGHLRGAVQAFSRFNSATSGVAGAVTLIGTAIGGLTASLAVVASQLGIAASAAGVMSGAAGALGAALTALTGPIGIAVAAIAGLAAAYKTNLFGIRDITNRVLGNISQLFSTHFGGFAQEAGNAMRRVRQVIQTALNAIMSLWNAHGQQLVATVKATFDGIGVAITTAMDVILGTVKATIQLLTGDWQGAWETMSGVVDRGVSRITGFIDRWNLVGRMQAKLSGMVDATRSAFTRAKEAALSPFRSLKNRITGFIDTIRSHIDNLMGRIQDAKDAMPSASDIPGSGAVGDAAETVGNNVPGLDTGGMLESNGLYMGHKGERVLNPSETDKLHSLLDGGGNLGGGGVQEVKLVLEERTDIVEGRIEQSAERVVVDQGRATRRNTGRNPNPR